MSVYLFLKFFVITFFDKSKTVDVFVIKPIVAIKNIYVNEILTRALCITRNW